MKVLLSPFFPPHVLSAELLPSLALVMDTVSRIIRVIPAHLLLSLP